MGARDYGRVLDSPDPTDQHSIRTYDREMEAITPPRSPHDQLFLVGEQRLDEFGGRERAQIIDAFAHTDEFQWNGVLLGDRCHDAALGGAVGLREDEAGQPDRRVKGLDLRTRVLPGIRLE